MYSGYISLTSDHNPLIFSHCLCLGKKFLQSQIFKSYVICQPLLSSLHLLFPTPSLSWFLNISLVLILILLFDLLKTYFPLYYLCWGDFKYFPPALTIFSSLSPTLPLSNLLSLPFPSQAESSPLFPGSLAESSKDNFDCFHFGTRQRRLLLRTFGRWLVNFFFK